jgi:hypothetical protein
VGVIAELFVLVGANTEPFTKGMEKVKGESEAAGANVGKFGGLAMGAGLLAAGAITGIAAFGVEAVKHSEEAGQAAYQMGEKFGFTGQQASSWLTVASHLGVSHEAMNTGLKALGKNIENLNLKGGAADMKTLDVATKSVETATLADAKAKQHLADVHAQLKGKITLSVGEQISLRNATEAVTTEDAKLSAAHTALIAAQGAVAQGNVQTSAAFKALGIEVSDGHGKLRNMNDVLIDAADKFKAMPDGMEKSGLAMKLFGKQGVEMLPILNLGSAGIKEMMEQGKKQGDVMSNEQVEAAHKLFLEHQKLDASISGITKQVGTGMMPMLSDLAEVASTRLIPALSGFLTWVSNIKQHITELQPWFPLIAGGLVILGGVMASILIPMFIAWTVATWAQVVALAAQAVALIAATWPLLLIILAIAAVVAIVVLLIQHWGLVKSVTLSVWGAIGAFFSSVWKGIHDTVLGFIQTIVTRFVDWAQWSRDLVPQTFGQIPQSLADIFGLARDAIFSKLGEIIAGASQLASRIGSGILNGILGALRGAGSALMEVIKGMLPGGANGAVAIALHAAGIPGFAFGGIVPGATGSPQLILAHGGERVQTEDQQRAGGAGDLSRVEKLLQDLIDAVTAPPTGQTEVGANLYKAMQGATMNRMRGMPGA